MKTCIKCGIEQPLDNYRWQSNKRTRHNQCRSCQRKWNKEWRKANPPTSEEARNFNLKRMYGISLVEWKKRLADQFWCCACCGDSWVDYDGVKEWHTDHDHKTGAIRGIICHYCNLMLGLAKDSVERLEAGIKYLEKWSD